MSRERAKGTDFETLVLTLIQLYDPSAHRLGSQGVKDRGDIWISDARYVIECKNESSYAGKLATWLGEANREAATAKKPYGIVVHKRRGTRDPAEQYVTLALGDYLELTTSLS